MSTHITQLVKNNRKSLVQKIPLLVIFLMAIALFMDLSSYTLIGYKIFMGYLSVIITLTGYGFYIASMYRDGQHENNKIKPHPLSWALFGLLTGTGYLIQSASSGQAGSWCLGVTAAFCFLIAGLSFYKYKWKFSGTDWAWIAVGLALFGFYIFTKAPTLSAILVTLADLAGYAPIIKKGWSQPNNDNPTNFIFNSLKCVPAILALSVYSLATSLYLLMLLFANGAVAAMLIVRRNSLANAKITYQTERSFKE